jgi:galactokinase
MTVKREEALRAHRQRFGQLGQVFAAPARVNLIGEHTDYTGGFVMPMAIDFQTLAVVSPRDDGRAVFYSANYDDEVSFEIAGSGRSPQGRWSDYPAGVLWSLGEAGVGVDGFSMSLSGDVPAGAGLSSSASLEVATAMALLHRAGAAMPLEQLATLCRRAENEYVGAKSGIMDQFASAGAVEHRVMMLDCRSLEYELLPLPEQIRVVICNSMVKHAVATGEYGDRSDEVEAGQAVLRQRLGRELSAASFARCRHIITENRRVQEAREALLGGDMVRFGRLLVEAHASFRDDFAASCAEVDELVEIATQQPECFGARITGGGFGGCTVNIVQAERTEPFVEAVRRGYAAKTWIEAQCFVCEASDGAIALAEKDKAR